MGMTVATDATERGHTTWIARSRETALASINK